MKPLKKNSIENKRRFKDGDKSLSYGKNNFCKMRCLRIIFFRGSNFREITTKIKTIYIDDIKITTNQ